MALHWPEHLLVKSILYTLSTKYKIQILVRFTIQTVILRYKAVENRKYSEWLQTDLKTFKYQKYHAY